MSLRKHSRRLSPRQFAIEQRAIRFRDEVGVSDNEELPLNVAARAIPGCEIKGHRHIPGIPYEEVVRLRTEGYRSFSALAARIEGIVHIVYNDEHHPREVRVNVMEEIFHVLLGHRPDIVTLVPRDGRHRTYDSSKEAEAEAYAKAALVPYPALFAMLAQQTHIERIAEHFAVPIEVVQERIGATDLGDMMNAQFLQYALLPQ
jgi:hypothetical protein